MVAAQGLAPLSADENGSTGAVKAKSRQSIRRYSGEVFAGEGNGVLRTL